MKIKKARKIHFKNRFKERVGYDISENQINNIKNNIIQNGKFLFKGENGSCFLYNHEGLELKIIYDISRNSLITVLP